MPRQPRIEFEGAIYHLIQDGAPGRRVFADADSAQEFEGCLFEACAFSGWVLHAYALRPEGFDLAVETPRANLVAGMRRLLSTFALRRWRGGAGARRYPRRYRAILVEPGPSLAAVAHFIHLAPVRGRVVPPELLRHFRWSSCRRWADGERPSFLSCGAWLDPAGGIGALDRYHDFLVRLAVDQAGQESLGFAGISRGWAVGSPIWRAAVANRPSVDFAAKQAERKARWERALERFLGESGRTRSDASRDPLGAEWKVAIARQIRLTTGATNGWLARELNMGAPGSVSSYLTRSVNPRPTRTG